MVSLALAVDRLQSSPVYGAGLSPRGGALADAGLPEQLVDLAAVSLDLPDVSPRYELRPLGMSGNSSNGVKETADETICGIVSDSSVIFISPSRSTTGPTPQARARQHIIGDRW
jgi:hypothetical protein